MRIGKRIQSRRTIPLAQTLLVAAALPVAVHQVGEADGDDLLRCPQQPLNNSATNGTWKGNVRVPLAPVTFGTDAGPVSPRAMGLPHAPNHLPGESNLDASDDLFNPRWARGYIFGENEIVSEFSLTSTLTAPPLPLPPSDKLSSAILAAARNRYPTIFSFSKQFIDIDSFAHLLLSSPNPHPNPSFVLSVVNALRNGFWPWGNGFTEEMRQPVLTSNHPSAQEHVAILRAMRDEEVAAGRWFPIDAPPEFSIQAPLALIPKKPARSGEQTSDP